MSVRKAVFDTVAMSFVNVVRLIAQFLAVPILSRLLSPADYGVVAMAMPFILFAMMIADAGIGMSLVRTPLSERKIWSTCFWLSVMLGAGLALLMMALAPVFSLLFTEPRLTSIVMGLALVVFIQSLSTIPSYTLQRELKFKILAGIEIIALAMGIASAVVTAIYGGGAWALVLQQLVFYTVKMLLTLWFSTFRPVRVFELHSVKEHLLFGRDVLSTNIIGFFTRSLDNLIIGKVLLAAAVGVYSMAFQFARLPVTLVSGPLQSVFYPRLSMVKDDTQAICGAFLALTRLLAILILPTMGMVAVAYQPVFTLLLSEKWAMSGRIFMLVSAVSALQGVLAICGTVRLVMGRTDYQLRATIESGVLWVIALLISVWFGLEAVAMAFSIVFLLYIPRTLALTLPLIGCSFGAYGRSIAVPSVVTQVSMGVYLLLQHALQMGSITQVMVAALFSLAGIAASAWVQRGVLMSQLRTMNLALPVKGEGA